MASIIISPTSASFSESGGSGSISLTVETANWHTTPQSGDIWMAQRKRTDGVWSSWVVFRIVGEDGEDGTGAAPVYVGEWSSSKSYYGSSVRTDIVKHNNQYWIAKTDANPSPFTNKEPGTSGGAEYWQSFGASFESIATGLLLAENANIANFIFQNQKMVSQSGGLVLDGVNGKITLGALLELTSSALKMFDSNSKERLLITSNDLGAMSYTGKSFSSDIVTGNTSSIDQTKQLIGTSDFNLSSGDNCVEIPPVDIDVYKDVGSNYLGVTCSLIVDSTVVSSVSYSGTTNDRHTYLTIPGKTLALASGTHTLKIRCQASGTGLSSITYGGGTMRISYNVAKVQIGGNGFRAALSATQYAQFVNDSTEGVVFALRNGNYGFRVTPAGFQKMTDGSTWQTLSL